jgi:hypothetical protein
MSNNRIQTALDMYQVNAPAFISVTRSISALITTAKIRGKDNPGVYLDAKYVDMIIEDISSYSEILAPLNARITNMGITMLSHRLSDTLHPMTHTEISNELQCLYDTLFREMFSTLILSIGSREIEFYSPKEPLFGREVSQKFPSIIYDIEQGGKCYACDLSTAAVYHWIRCLEAGIYALARSLRIPDPEKGAERNWSNRNKKIKEAIDKTWPNGRSLLPEAKLFRGIHSALDAMNNPYRNETMHLDAKYTCAEALHIFELVKGVMQKIASRMDEQGLPLVDGKKPYPV